MFEKAGVNISVVYGEMHEDQIKSMKSRGKDVSLEGKNTFFATGKFVSSEGKNINILQLVSSSR